MPDETTLEEAYAPELAMPITEASILVQQGAILQKGGKPEDLEAASERYRAALLVDPGNPDALHLLGMCHHGLGDHRMATVLVKRACQIAPYEGFFTNLGVVAMSCMEVDTAAAAFRHSLTFDPRNPDVGSRLIFILDNHPGMTPRLLLEERRRYNEKFCADLTAAAPPHTNSPDSERRINIGYVSADFRVHSASMAFSPVIANHDSKHFKVHLYSTSVGAPFDALSKQFQDKADVWEDVSGISDTELADRIRADKIDVLVDLAAWSSGGRLQAFARKPAPIQITAWGYATGTGMDAMDYLVADDVTVPPDLEDLYSERILRMPAIMPFEPGTNPPEPGPLPFSKNGYVTFGYLGRPIKLHQDVLHAWARIMRAVPNSCIIMKGGEYRDQIIRERISELMVSLGVGIDRLQFLPETVLREHRETYNLVDIALDPWPVGSGITTFEALLMGVPTVTRLGQTISSRLAAALMHHVGLKDHPSSLEEYIARAIELAGQPELLTEYRQTLRKRLLGSILTDGPGYTRAFEKRVREVWRAWCSEQRRKAA